MQSQEGVTRTLLVMSEPQHSPGNCLVCSPPGDGASYLVFVIPWSITDAVRAWRCTGKVGKGLVSCLERGLWSGGSEQVPVSLCQVGSGG